MGTDVQKTSSNALAAAQALKGNLQKVRSNMPETRGSGFMSFGRDGIWTFGQSNEEVKKEWEIAINPLSIETGFICWSDRGDSGPKNEVLGEVMVKLGGDVPLKHTLQAKEDEKSIKTPEWREQYKVQMRFLSGPHKDVQVTFATTSLGGIDAIGGLVDQIMLQLDEDPEYIVPVVSLESSHYIHKKYGKTYTPVINIAEWMSMDDTPAEEDEPEQEEETAPKVEEKPKRTRKAKPEPEEVELEEVADETPEEVDEKPATRTRRRR